MRKGVSPVVATVILISVAVVSGIIIYWWVTSFEAKPSGLADEPYEIDASPLNWTTGEVTIRNVDYRDMSALTIYIAQNQSKSCSLPALDAGEATNCTFGTGLTGQVTIYGRNVKDVTLLAP